MLWNLGIGVMRPDHDVAIINRKLGLLLPDNLGI